MARKKRLPPTEDDEPGLNLSALIDVSFLLLIYFIVTSTLQPKEGDLGLALPSSLPSNSSMKLDPLTIRLNSEGQVYVSEALIEDDINQRNLTNLQGELTRYKQTCEATDSNPIVVVAADDESVHQRFTDIINTLAKVGISNITLTGFSD